MRVQSYENYITIMKIREKIFRGGLMATMLFLLGAGSAHGQVDFTQDTLECHIVGFNFGIKAPSAAFSHVRDMNGNLTKEGTMASLYKAPYLEYGINWLYKFKSNWVLNLDGNLWIGSDNLKLRQERMSNVYSRDSIVISGGGYDAGVSCFNRGISLQVGGGKIIPLDMKKNPNSGILARLYGGYMLQQSIFYCNEAEAHQVMGDYALLYDHQRSGWLLTEGVGYWFMSNNLNLLNLYVELSVQQCWSHSTRDYMIDNLLDMHGKDNNRYFDMLYMLKVCWMFPLRGKQAHDLYFY